MKIFITGGTGFIGSHLIDSLVAHEDTEVYALVRDLNNLKWLEGLSINFLEGDLFSIPALPSDINYVFHLAGSTKARKSADYYTVNQEGTASLFQTLIAQGISPNKVILLSTLAASGPCQQGTPVKENDTPCPVSPYGQSKLESEKEALKYKDKFSLAIIRVGPVFGPRDRDFISYFKLIKMGILPEIGVSQRFSICYVKDLITALQLCLEKESGSGEIFNIADPHPYSWEEFGRVASHVLDKELRSIKVPYSLAYLIAFCAEILGKVRKKPSILSRDKFKEMKQEAWIVNTQKAADMLSFHPEYSLQEGLRETIEWYLSRGWL
jgi:dihydroflavonol-4-reductase